MQKVLWATVCLVAFALVASAETVGWRGDGTGRFPNADPPTEWAKDKNIVWATKMPSWSNATPIIVGDKIFMMAEPSILVCCSVADGKILWQKPHDYFDTLPPEELSKAQEIKKQADELIKQLGPIEGKFNDLNGLLGRLPDLRKKWNELPGQVAATEEQVKTIQASFDQQNAELAKTPDNADLKKKVDEIKKQLDEQTRKLKEIPNQVQNTLNDLKRAVDENALKTQVADLKKQVEELRAKLAPVNTYVVPGTEGSNGYTSPTPVSDGKNVWVLTTNGVAACYDLDGNRKWARMLPKHGGGLVIPLIFGES